MACTEFYCIPSGSQLNSGHTETPSAYYTSLNGNYNATTNVFTPADGSNPVSSGVAVGDFVSIYTGTTPGYVARITAVTNAPNGAITTTTAFRSTYIGISTGTANIRVGGAWRGPDASDTFPFSSSNLGTLNNLNGDPTRINIRNDRSYVITAGLFTATTEPAVIQGYQTIPGDGHAAVISGNVGGGLAILRHQTDGVALIADLIFQNTNPAGSANCVDGGSSHTYLRCGFYDARGWGLSNGSRVTAIECEFRNCNRSNAANLGCAQADIDSSYIRCYFHDSVSHGIVAGSVNPCQITVIECIFDTLTGNGIHWVPLASSTIGTRAVNCDFYNLSGSGIFVAANAGRHLLYVENSNFLKNGAYGINGNGVKWLVGLVTNCGFGTGSMANVSGDLNQLRSVSVANSITYASDKTPWENPVIGDFLLVDPSAVSTGRGAFPYLIPGANTITSIPLSTKGEGYTSVPTVSITSSNQYTPASAVASLELSTRLIINGGTGYQPGDQLAIEGGTYDANGPAVLNVIAVGPGGTVRFEEGGNTNFTYRGKYSAVPSGTRNLIGGSGSGATATLTWRVGYVDLTNGGLYGDVPTVALVGGGSPSTLASLGTIGISSQASVPLVGYPDVGAAFALRSAIITGGGGGGGGAGEGGGEPLVIKLPRPTIKVRDPELASLIRRARRAAQTIENLSIVGDGVSGDSSSGFGITSDN